MITKKVDDVCTPGSGITESSAIIAPTMCAEKILLRSIEFDTEWQRVLVQAGQLLALFALPAEQ